MAFCTQYPPRSVPRSATLGTLWLGTQVLSLILTTLIKDKSKKTVTFLG